MTPPLISVVVAICTFRRPELADALASVTRQNVPPWADLSILVIDNDDAPSAGHIVREQARSATIPIRYVHCPFGNISIARNGALRQAEARFLVFLDDDEVADQNWLTHLLETQRETGASVVLGPVAAMYDPETPDWITRLDPHSTNPVYVNGSIRTGYSCNVLMDLSDPSFEGLTFDLSLGRSGGEDTAYFTHAAHQGARFAEAKKAVVRETVPHARATFAWLARRRFRSGQTHGRLLGEHIRTARLCVEISLATLKIAYCAALATLLLPDTVRRNGAALRGILHAGMIAGLFGSHPITLYDPTETGATQ